jgi:hypothetical protein
MARSQVADGGTASIVDGSCEYIEYTVADSRQGVVLQLGSWASCKTSHRKNISCYEIFTHQSSKGLILWYDLSNVNGTSDLVLGMLGACKGHVHLHQQPENYQVINWIWWVYRRLGGTKGVR